jgi:type IV pilus assembly protein PilA
MATSMAKKLMEDKADDLAEGAAGIVGYHMAKGFTELIDPKIEGNRLTLELPMIGGDSAGAMFVPMVGVLAAVAIPAFMKYIKKSKSSEASMMLHKLDMGARELLASGQPLPPSVGPTPDPMECFNGGSEKHAPNASHWENPTWTALQFSMDDPHYYSYEFVNKGDQYELRAYGDLDCDGALSTFILHSGSDDIIRDMELE